ncbi:phosphatidylinositol N-acetylglucosaminyltransferase subunit P-like isoform X2 [Mercenaria mercenaria]|uniref:phosphatidylinositol N-acetylglucosaminyltransferase subunit P-like isoform X2 n=1 Tax=Mercenaria mercenaria TaxID=6596 RepID=UPI001E1DE44F|nr:phosphatidylinositol N-acetylglucosaminyltransferase subunit P-like isoform X2 [Mercenaria mercenaria]
MSSPSPTPVRAIYGFVLYLAAYVIFVVYVVWAYVPDTWLDAVGLSYWPQKYWAVAVPCYLCMLWVLAYPAWFGYIHLCTAPLDCMDLITDEFSQAPNRENIRDDNDTPPLADISISEVNRKLYLQEVIPEEH